MFNKLIDIFLVILVLIYIVFEELVWEKIAKPILNIFSNFILQFQIVEKIVLKIKSLNRYLILFIFLIFFTIVELLGVYAAIVFVQGYISLAIFIYLLKLPLAVLILWFFDITKEKLLQFRWFEIVYEKLIYLKNRIKNSKIYLLIYEKIASIKEYFKNNFTFSKHSLKDKVIKIYKILKAKIKF
ncbi:hypothetical protein [Arcobacter vandammei]|uniref:hypothetical protein n=1 Tax=Arcobacter vandammei TaxID=2782243 RepID=UPI0018E02BC8|nr:hypothetical protein [Arcobacter vandammei]